jgi:predicted nucleic acid-binding protein
LLVVADTGPLISLAVINKLDLLDALFEQVVIPEAVWRELEKSIEKLSIPQVRRFQNNIVPVTHYKKLNPDIDSGEEEAIILFEEIHADQLLIEDKGARHFAEDRGIICTGTLGVLVEAKNENLISDLRPLFYQLRINHRYFALPLVNQILFEHGEKPLD